MEVEGSPTKRTLSHPEEPPVKQQSSDGFAADLHGTDISNEIVQNRPVLNQYEAYGSHFIFSYYFLSMYHAVGQARC